MDNNVKYGMSAWDDEPRAGGGNSGAPGVKAEDYMKWKNGKNPVRVLSKPFKYNFHSFKVDGDAGMGVKIRCTTKDDCPLCVLAADEKLPKEKRASYKAKVGRYVPIIDRSENRYKLADVSSSLYGHIKTLNDDDEWGNPEQYDITVVVKKGGPPAEYYKASPKQKTPLSEEDLAVKRSINVESIEKLCTPLSRERVLEKMKMVLEKSGKTLESLVNSSSTTNMEGGDEETADFKEVD